MPNLDNNLGSEEEWREWNVHSFTTIHAVLWFFIGVLGTILQTKNSQASPFKTDYGTMSAFMVIIFFYVITMLVEINLKTHHTVWAAIFRKINVGFGTLTSVLLMLEIVPAFGWFTFIIWFLAFTMIARQTFYQRKEFLCKEIPLIFKKILNMLLFKKTINAPIDSSASEQQRVSTV